MTKRMQRNCDWRCDRECLESYKSMDGSLDGSKKMAKMEPFGILVDTGKHGSKETGMDAQVYLVKLVKIL